MSNSQRCKLPRSTTLTHKVLLTMHYLQGNRRYHKGLTVCDITSNVEKQFIIDGDVKTQVMACLKYCKEHGYVGQNGNKYGLITNAATIHLSGYQRAEEMCKIVELYPTMWENSSDEDLEKNDVNNGKSCNVLKKRRCT